MAEPLKAEGIDRPHVVPVERSECGWIVLRTNRQLLVTDLGWDALARHV